MNRSKSPPVHLHLGRKTPVHLHIKGQPKRLSRLEQQELSCTEMSAGRPSLRACSTSPHCSNRSGYWGSGSSRSKANWVPPPAKTTGSTKLTWEGPTHCLEINPDLSGSTVLHLSDLNGEDNCNRKIDCDHYEKKVDTLKAEVNHLKAEMDIQRSLLELEERKAALRNSQELHKTLLDLEEKKSAIKESQELQKSLLDLEERKQALRESQELQRQKEAELSACQDDLFKLELENAELKCSLSHSGSPVRQKSILDMDGVKDREELLSQLAVVEIEGSAVMKDANRLKASIKKLQRDRRFVSIQACQVSDNKDRFTESLQQFEKSSRILSRLLHAQQAYQMSVAQVVEERERFEQKFKESRTANLVLRERLVEQEKLAAHAHALHDDIGQKDGQIQSLNIRIQSLEEQLQERDLHCAKFQASLSDTKRQYQKEKELLKKASKQHKDRANQCEQTLGSITAQLEQSIAQLSDVKARLAISEKQNTSYQAEITSLKLKIQELDAALSQSHAASKIALEAANAKLSEKMHQLSCSQMEVDRLKNLQSSLEAQLQSKDEGYMSKVSALESELSQAQGRVQHYDEMLREYKAQLERSRGQFEEVQRDLRMKEQEIDQVKQEGLLETEKCRLKLQQQMIELEPMPELLKSSEQRLSDAQERLLAHEHRSDEQNRLVNELRLRAEQSAANTEALKEKLHEAIAEKRAMEVKLLGAEQRQQEAEKQNRELLGISGRKEDMVQRLQKRVEELVQELATTSAQMETGKLEARRHVDQIKERAANKERANMTRISELEAQLGRANSLATQFRKSKEDLDRRYHSRVHELQDKLDQSNSTKRSLENYITFLKSSYASVFSDAGHMPASSMPPLN